MAALRVVHSLSGKVWEAHETASKGGTVSVMLEGVPGCVYSFVRSRGQRTEGRHLALVRPHEDAALIAKQCREADGYGMPPAELAERQTKLVEEAAEKRSKALVSAEKRKNRRRANAAEIMAMRRRTAAAEAARGRA